MAFPFPDGRVMPAPLTKRRAEPEEGELGRPKKRKLADEMMDVETLVSEGRSPAPPPTTLPRLGLPASCTLVSLGVGRAAPAARFMDMPLEIVEKIHMESGSETLPMVNKRFRDWFSGVHYKARWALYTYGSSKDRLYDTKVASTALDSILSRRFCDKAVLLRVLEIWEKRVRAAEAADYQRRLKKWEVNQETRRQNGEDAGGSPPSPRAPPPPPKASKIPRRLLRTPKGTAPRLDPYVLFLVTKFGIDPNADASYPLVRGAADGNYDLVAFLLGRGAKVTKHLHIAFKAAIMNRDLQMMRLLIEPAGLKRHKKKDTAITSAEGDLVPLADRIQCPREWVDLALKHEAYDIVHWLVDEKGLTPTLNRIMGLQTAGYDAQTLDKLMAGAPPPGKKEKGSKQTKRKKAGSGSA